MSDTAPQLSHGDEYIVFFHGGPFDGQTERRISTDGSWDTEITMILGQEGIDTQLVYTATGAEKRGDQVQVAYSWDEADSEQIIDNDERGDS